MVSTEDLGNCSFAVRTTSASNAGPADAPDSLSEHLTKPPATGWMKGGRAVGGGWVGGRKGDCRFCQLSAASYSFFPFGYRASSVQSPGLPLAAAVPCPPRDPLSYARADFVSSCLLFASPCPLGSPPFSGRLCSLPPSLPFFSHPFSGAASRDNGRVAIADEATRNSGDSTFFCYMNLSPPGIGDRKASNGGGSPK